MAPAIIKMSYEDMATMAQTFDKSAQNIDTLVAAMRKVGDLIKQGALTGAPGENFENAVTQTFVSKLQTLHEDLVELRNDIRAAERDMRTGDQDGANAIR